jgi:tRNA(adenine34) deaminase
MRIGPSRLIVGGAAASGVFERFGPDCLGPVGFGPDGFSPEGLGLDRGALDIFDSSCEERSELMTSKDALSHMARALSEAEAAGARGEVPIGAVIVSPEGRVVAADGNRTREFNDPTAHAEMLVIRAACAALADERLVGCSLYVTLEPCPMCAAAISFARIKRLFYAASDPKGGGVEQGARIFSQATCHHVPEIYPGIGEVEAGALLKNFFAVRRI